jgi:hypothetical protein
MAVSSPGNEQPLLHEQHSEKLTSWRDCWILQDMLRQLFTDIRPPAQFKDAATFARFLMLNRTYGTLQHSIHEKWNNQQSNQDKVAWNRPTKLWMNIKLQLRSQMNAREVVRWSKPTIKQLNDYQKKALLHNKQILQQIPELQNSDTYIETVKTSMIQLLRSVLMLDEAAAASKIEQYQINSDAILQKYRQLVVENIIHRNILIDEDEVHDSDAKRDKFDYDAQEIPGT